MTGDDFKRTDADITRRSFFLRTKNMTIDEGEMEYVSLYIFERTVQRIQMKIEQIMIDENKEIGPQLKELSLNEDVYILFNAYSTLYRLYEKSKALSPEDLKWEKCWRLRPFKEFYLQRRDRPFFEEEFLMSLRKGTALVEIV